jgi:hypothetical protein
MDSVGTPTLLGCQGGACSASIGGGNDFSFYFTVNATTTKVSATFGHTMTAVNCTATPTMAAQTLYIDSISGSSVQVAGITGAGSILMNCRGY